jgi:hypothetical protein
LVPGGTSIGTNRRSRSVKPYLRASPSQLAHQPSVGVAGSVGGGGGGGSPSGNSCACGYVKVTWSMLGSGRPAKSPSGRPPE